MLNRFAFSADPIQLVQLISTIAWLASQPRGRNLTQGQVSIILSDKYQYLDSDPQNKSKLNSKRNYLREHEELELALFEWQQRMQGKMAVITGDILKAKARSRTLATIATVYA
ncbi:hypothetical protein K3495_g4808 [Podosphaera aphanis]|nr:hypothetical protein K3495_g4808 [Podosphaera aphanis]